MSASPFIFDVTTEQFQQLVLENSFHKPVLVDFWADWCAPCKALMPILSSIAESYQGELLLAKVNCDLEPEITAQFGIRSLPTVVLFKDGQPVDGFAGAQPESAIREMLEKHIAAPEEVEADLFAQAQDLFADSQFAVAEEALKTLLSEDNTHEAALILYARCLAERGALDDAAQVLNSVKGDEHKQALAQARAQLTFLEKVRDLPEPALLKSRLAQDANDAEAAYQLTLHQLARQQYETALENLLQLFIHHRDYSQGLPHSTLLQVFDLLGGDHPLVTTYRRKLYQAIY